MIEHRQHGTLVSLIGTALTGAGTVMMQYAPMLLGFLLTLIGLVADYYNRRANKQSHLDHLRQQADADACSQRQHEANRFELLNLEQSIRVRQLSGGPSLNGEKTVCQQTQSPSCSSIASAVGPAP